MHWPPVVPQAPWWTGCAPTSTPCARWDCPCTPTAAPLTTKLHGIPDGAIGAPVSIGGVPVHTGDVVLGDANGLIIAPAARLAAIVDEAITDDAEEPELIAQLWEGEPLGSLTGATETVRRLQSSV